MKKLFIAALAALTLMACTKTEQASTTLHDIQTRTSIRHYTDQQLTDAQIEQLLRAGMSAPTACNKQPWEFVVVRDAATRTALAEAFGAWRMAAEAPVVFVVCGNMLNALEGDNQSYWIEDCSAATENILLAAHAIGLGGVWCGVRPSAERCQMVSQLVGLPSYVKPLCLVCVGYPAENPEPKDKWNTEKIHNDKW